MMRKESARGASELAWFKSSHSGGANGESCVEVAIGPRAVHVRDSKTRPWTVLGWRSRLGRGGSSWRTPRGGDVTDLAWFKSSYSGGNDGESCVEVAITPVPSTSVTPGTAPGAAPGCWGRGAGARSSPRCAEVAVGQGELSVNSVATLFESFAPGRSQRFR